jgi:hypothetical protein
MTESFGIVFCLRLRYGFASRTSSTTAARFRFISPGDNLSKSLITMTEAK